MLYSEAAVVPGVISGLKYRGGRRRAAVTKAGRADDIGAVGLKHPFLVEPVALRAALAVDIENVQDRDMRAL